MKTVVLFGAGQVGAMISRLMGGEFSVVCFADNSEAKRGTILAGIPVTSPEESLLFSPDCFCLCVLDDERADEMEKQLRGLGFEGPILRPDALRVFDTRVATMRLLAEQVCGENIPGDIAELGVYRGDFAALLNASFPDRALHLFDTFEGFSPKDIEIEQCMNLSGAKVGDFSGTTVDLVRKRLPYPERAVFYKGYFPDTFKPCIERTFVFVSIDADLYAPTAAALPLFWDRLSPGGVLMIHDVSSTQFGGAGRAVWEFCGENGLYPMPVCDLHGSAVLRKERI